MQPKTLLERNQQILDRIHNLKVLEPKLRDIFTRGKREHLLQGMSADGLRFAPLKPSTLAQRDGHGFPLTPHGSASSLITQYQVHFEYPANTLIVSAGWPMDWVRYHVSGTGRMARRDPGGFRREDSAEALRLMREYIFQP